MILTDEQITDIYKKGYGVWYRYAMDLTEEIKMKEKNGRKAVAQAEHEATLKAVGEWLEQFNIKDSGQGYYWASCKEYGKIHELGRGLESLKQGKLPT